jgi:hypothetical protein
LFGIFRLQNELSRGVPKRSATNLCQISPQEFDQTSGLLLCWAFFRFRKAARERQGIGGFGKRYSNKGTRFQLGRRTRGAHAEIQSEVVLAAFGHPCRQESSADIYHDVEGMEHHISPQTLQAIEALLFELRQDPTLVARIRSRASGSRGSA